MSLIFFQQSTRDDGFLSRSQMFEIILGDRKFLFADKYGSRGSLELKLGEADFVQTSATIKMGAEIFLAGEFIRRIRIYTSYIAGHDSRCAWI